MRGVLHHVGAGRAIVVEAHHQRLAQIGARQLGAIELRAAHAAAAQIGARQIGVVEIGDAQIGAHQGRVVEPRVAEDGAVEPRAGEIGAGQILVREIGARQIVIGQHRALALALFREIALVELQNLTQFLGIELPHLFARFDAFAAVHYGIKAPDPLRKC